MSGPTSGAHSRLIDERTGKTMDITYEIARAEFDFRATRAREERHPKPSARRHVHVPRVRRPLHEERVA
jgi:hypothetical protein